MKISNFKSQTYKIFVLVFIILMSLFFSSCENFLGGEDLKNKIEDLIEIENAPSVKVRLTSDQQTGTFPVAKDLDVKVGKKFSVEFILNDSNYVFNKWLFLNAENVELNTEHTISYSEKISENVHTLYVTILSNIDSLLIKPECFLIPRATSYLPEMIEEGKPQDSSIVVVFNTPVKTEDFDGTFNNISIKAGGEEISAEYFESPVLSNDNTVLTIQPKKDKPIITDLTNNSTKDVTVTLKTGSVVSVTGVVQKQPLSNLNSTAIFQNDITWTYRINQQRDIEVPIMHSINLYKDEQGEIPVINEDFSSWVIDDYYNNHTNQLFVKINGSDVGSGVNKILLKEEYIKTTTGTDVTNEPLYSDYTFVDNAIIPVVFKNVNDGVVKLTFSIVDYANNESVEKGVFYVIKDTRLENSCIKATTINSKVEVDPYKNSTSSTLSFREADENGIDTVEIECKSSEKMFYRSYKSSFTFNMESCYDGSSYSTENITRKTDTSFILKRDTYKNTYVKITATDELGNTNSIIRFIPRAVSIIEKPILRETKPYGQVFKQLLFTADELTNLYGLRTSINAPTSNYAIFYRKVTEPADTKVYTNLTGTNITGNYYGENIDQSLGFRYETDSVRDLDDGTYDFYISYAYSFNDSTNWINCIGKPYRLKIAYDEGSKEYTFTYSGEKPEQSVLPNDFTVNYDSAVRNKGTRTVYITTPEDFVKNESYTYYVKYTKNSSSPTSSQYIFYSQDFTFEVESGYKYYFYIVAKDNENHFETTTNETKILDATEDNVKPFIYMSPTMYPGQVREPAKIRLTSLYRPNDKTGLLEENGKIPFTYFMVRNNTDTQTAVVLTEEELYANYEPKYVEFTKNATSNSTEEKGAYMDFYFDEKDEGWYTVYIKAIDSSPLENYAYLSFTISNKTNGKKINAEFKNNGTAEIPKLELTLTPNTSIKAYVASLKPTGEWNKKFFDTFSNDRPNTFDIEDYQDGFIKVVLCEESKHVYYDTAYYYPLNYDNKIVCENKNLLKCERGYQVYNDSNKPMFIHTLACKYNLGDDAQNWFNKGIETNLVTKSLAMFTYNPDLSSIPDGYWYTIIAHYADNDIIMTKPVQKKR